MFAKGHNSRTRLCQGRGLFCLDSVPCAGCSACHFERSERSERSREISLDVCCVTTEAAAQRYERSLDCGRIRDLRSRTESLFYLIVFYLVDLACRRDAAELRAGGIGHEC